MSFTPRPEREFGTAGGELDDAVTTRVGEALDGGVDALRADAVDGRERERVLLGAAQHLGVDLGRGDGHGDSSRRSSSTCLRSISRTRLSLTRSAPSGSAPCPCPWRRRPRRPGPAGSSSTIARTPDSTAKCMVSSTSRDVPDGWPVTDRPALIRSSGLIGSGSGGHADGRRVHPRAEPADGGGHGRRVRRRRQHDGRPAELLQLGGDVGGARVDVVVRAELLGVVGLARRRGRWRRSRSPSPGRTARRGGPARRRRAPRRGRRPWRASAAAR